MNSPVDTTLEGSSKLEHQTVRRERNRLAVTKYRQTEAGKASMARYVAKRRERNAAAKLACLGTLASPA